MADFRKTIKDLETRVARLERTRKVHSTSLGKLTAICRRFYRTEIASLAWERGTELRIPQKPKILKRRTNAELWKEYNARKTIERRRQERYMPWL